MANATVIRACAWTGIAGALLLALHQVEDLLWRGFGPETPGLFWRLSELHGAGHLAHRFAWLALSLGMVAGIVALAVGSGAKRLSATTVGAGVWILGIAFASVALLYPGWSPYSVRGPSSTPLIEDLETFGPPLIALGTMVFAVDALVRRAYPVLPLVAFIAAPFVMVAAVFFGPDPAMETADWATLAVAAAFAWLCVDVLRRPGVSVAARDPATLA